MKKLAIFVISTAWVTVSMLASGLAVHNITREDIRVSVGQKKTDISASPRQYNRSARTNGTDWIAVPSDNFDGKLEVNFKAHDKPLFVFISEGAQEGGDKSERQQREEADKVGKQHVADAYIFDISKLGLGNITALVYFHDKDNKRRLVVDGTDQRSSDKKISVVVDGEMQQK